MFIELHLLQNFAPSNLNRDDTGSPKDCEFGGYRRARISSQCLKRAIRTYVRDEVLLTNDDLGARTKRLVDELVERLERADKPAETARVVAEATIRGAGLALKDGKTQYLLFLASREIDAFTKVCLEHWDALAVEPVSADKGAATSRSGRDTKKAGKDAVSAEVKVALANLLDGGKAADVAMFGRMIADLPGRNVDAACQVAHAISTNKVSTMEFDFYTAVDDLKPEETAGADMLGTVEFNSACFYRYLNIDANQLLRNLGGDTELCLKSLDAFIRAAIGAVPTGKQNSMAAQNPPSFVLAVARERGLWSLANAFVEPILPRDGGLVRNSIGALDRYWGKLVAMYGERGIVGHWLCSLEDGGLTNLASAQVEGVDALTDKLLGAVHFADNGRAGVR